MVYAPRPLHNVTFLPTVVHMIYQSSAMMVHVPSLQQHVQPTLLLVLHVLMPPRLVELYYVQMVRVLLILHHVPMPTDVWMDTFDVSMVHVN